MVYVIYHEKISQCPIYKNFPSAFRFAVCGDVCQMYTRIWWLHRNLLIFVPRCIPRICQVFGSQYSQVKPEGPLHMPGVYQSVVSLGKSVILLVYEVFLLKETSIYIYCNFFKFIH